jgi:hypothetical protein
MPLKECTNMRYLTLALILVLCWGYSLAQKDTTPEMKIAISSDVSEIPITGDVPIRMEFQNASDRAITYKLGIIGVQDVSDSFEVRGPDGNLIRPRYDLSNGIKAAKWVSVPLGPRQIRVISNVLDASNYGFSAPGEYTIRMRRQSEDPSVGPIYSNTITVRVTDWDKYMAEEKIRSDLQISLLPVLQEILVGDKINIEMTFTNEGKLPASCSSSLTGPIDIVDQLEVRDSSGAVVTPNFGPNWQWAAGNSWACDVLPQKSVTRDVLVSSKAYGLNEPSSYKIRLCRGRYRTDAPTVCSNTVEVRVVSAKGAMAGE